MQSLVVRSLALRQLGRLPPRRLLAVGFGLRPTAWSPRSLSSRQLWGSPAPGGLRGPGALGGLRGPGVLGRDAQPLRNKSKKRSAYGSNQEEEEEEEVKEEERDPEASDQEEEDPGQPKDYKDLDKHVQSFRYDVIVKAGLDVARKNKSKKRSAYGSTREEEEEKEEEKEEKEEEERDPEASDQEEEDPGQPKDYKDLDKHVQSFRYDVIVKAGLDVARKNKSKKRSAYGSNREEENEEEKEEEKEEEEEEDPGQPKDYKDLDKHVQSFRYDVIVKAGLDVARKNKSKKRSAYGSMREEEEEEEEEEKERDPEASDQEEEDPGQPKDYKDLDKHVQSFRYDVIVKAGLDVARKNKSKKRSAYGSTREEEEEKEEEKEEKEEEERDPEASDQEEEDIGQPKDYKDLDKHVQSFRYDVIVKAGLDVARKNKSKKRSAYGSTREEEEEKEEEKEEKEEEERDPEASDQEEEDIGQPKDYKDLDKHVQSFRYDVIVKAGLDVARKNKSKKRSAYGSMREEEEEEEEEEKERDPEASDHEEEDIGLHKDYKDLDKHVQSFRYDVIVKAGLDVARNKIEDAFYSNKLRLNGQKLIKKSKTVKVGDTLDLVLSEDQDSVTLMRVVLRKAFGETGSSPEKHRVSVRRWKNLQLPRNEAFKA